MWKKNWLTCWNSNLSHSRNTDQYGHLVLKICFLNFFFVVVPESCVHVGNKCLFHPNPQPLWVGDLNLKRYNHLLLRKRITLSSHNAWYPLTLFASFVCSILQIIFYLLVFPFFFLNSVVIIVFSSELNYGYSAGPLNAWFFFLNDCYQQFWCTLLFASHQGVIRNLKQGDILHFLRLWTICTSS